MEPGTYSASDMASAPLAVRHKSAELNPPKTLLTHGDSAPKILKTQSLPSLNAQPALRAKSAIQLGEVESPTAEPQELITRRDRKHVTFGGAECRKFRVELGGLA